MISEGGNEMRDLSIAQEYMICAVNTKGKISGFSTEKLVCFIAAALLELQLENCVKIDKKRVTVIDSLPEEKQYLKPLYDFLDQSKPVRLEKIVETYNYSMTDKKLNELFNSIGTSLNHIGLAKVVKTGISGRRNAYIPTAEAVHYAIDMIRAELLENVEITEDIASLVILLEKSKTLKVYFSKYEQNEIKKKIREITNSDTGKMIKAMIDYVENMIAVMSTFMVLYS